MFTATYKKYSIAEAQAVQEVFAYVRSFKSFKARKLATAGVVELRNTGASYEEIAAIIRQM